MNKELEMAQGWVDGYLEDKIDTVFGGELKDLEPDMKEALTELVHRSMVGGFLLGYEVANMGIKP